MVDTGASSNLSGMEFYDKVIKDCVKHTKVGGRFQLESAKQFSGVGGAQSSTHEMDVYGCTMTCDGDPLLCHYEAPMLDGPPGSHAYLTPALLGMPQLRNLNAYIGCKRNELTLIPDGLDDLIVWPKGTVHINCDQSDGNHMIIPCHHWSRFPGMESYQMHSVEKKAERAKHIANGLALLAEQHRARL